MAVKKKSAANKKSAVKSAIKKTSKRASSSKAFAHAGAKVDQLLARGQKRLKAIQDHVAKLEEKSRAFLAHPTSNATIKKIQVAGHKANQSRQRMLKATDQAHRKHAKAVLKGDLKAAREHMSDMTALGNALKGVFTFKAKN